MPTSGNVYIDALAGESWTDVGRDTHITYSMSSAYGVGWTPELKAEFAASLASIAEVCGLTFECVADDAQADLVEYRVTGSQFKAAFPSSPYGPYQVGWAGYQYGPGDAGAGAAEGYYDTTQLGSWLILHELLHGLGLEHPHTAIHGTGLFPGVTASNDLGDYGLNNTLTTVMSYNILAGYEAGGNDGPMAFDIAALQELYGANMATGAGNDVYTVARADYRSIWDAGGNDWLVAGTDAGATVDLRAATLEVGGDAAGYLSQADDATGGYTLAHGVVIENARGGAGDDTLVGNDAVNVLEGGGGDDLYYTDDPNDVIIDTTGTDCLVSSVDATLVGRETIENLALSDSATVGTGNSFDNVIWGNGYSNVLDGGGGDDWLFGESGNDWLFGSDGDDLLVGGLGRDYMSGGVGADVFDFNGKLETTLSQRDVITDFQRGLDDIDLSTIDASTKKGGNQAFAWIGTKSFSGTAGQLHYVKINPSGTASDKTYIEGDLNGDKVADLRIELTGLYDLSKSDFIL